MRCKRRGRNCGAAGTPPPTDALGWSYAERVAWAKANPADWWVKAQAEQEARENAEAIVDFFSTFPEKFHAKLEIGGEILSGMVFWLADVYFAGKRFLGRAC